MAEAAAELRAAADKVRERAREVRFAEPEKEDSPLERILGRLNRRGAAGRSSPRGPVPSK